MASYELGKNPVTSQYEDLEQSQRGSQKDRPDKKNPLYAQKSTRSAKCIYVLVLIDRLLTAALSLVVTAIMAYTMQVYISHKNMSMDNKMPFGMAPRTWPTFMMLGIGAFTALFNLVQVLAYLCGRHHVQRVANMSTYIKLLSPIGHVIAWTASAAAFKAASNGSDLWGFSCSNMPSIVDIQQQFSKAINYNRLCTVNTNSWYISIVTAVLAVFSVIVWVVVTMYEFSQARRAKVRRIDAQYEGYRHSGVAN